MPRKRKRRSWGSITTVSRNKHVLRWTQDTPSGRKRLTRTFHGTYREADAELARTQTEVGTKGPEKTVGYVYDAWYLPSLERRLAGGKLKEHTLKIYDRAWRLHVAPRWARVPLSKVMRLDVQDWLLTLTEGDAKTSLKVLRGTLDAAVRFEAVDANKLRGFAPELPPKSRARSKAVYTLGQAEGMLERLRGGRCEAPFIMACFGGARTGESLGARCAEVEMRHARGLGVALVPIVRRMERTGDLPKPDGDLKNAQSARVAAIPEPYGTRLYEIARAKLAEGVEWLADRGDGLPMNIGMLQGSWTKDAGDAHIPFSNLRASWRTFTELEWGVQPNVLELLMGHSIPGVTGRHYLRPVPETLADSLAEAVLEYRKRMSLGIN